MHTKKIRKIIAALTFALLSSGWVHPAWAVPPSILSNSGAESGDFTGWTADVTDESWTISSSDAHGGSKSFLSGNGTNTLTQTVDLLGLGYTEAQLDSIAGVSLSAWVKEHDDAGENDTYDVGLQMLGSGLGAMAITSLPDPHVAPTEWTQRELGLGNYGAGMRYLRVILASTDGAGTPGNHGAIFDDMTLSIIGDSTAPTLTSMSPADGAAGVTIRPELTLNFSEDVTAGSGNITVHRASNDEAIATIDVTSDAVQGSGTDIITIELPGNLSKGTEYYITIDAGAFKDIWENAYAGISLSTTWNFRTQSSSNTSASTVSAADYTITNLHTTVNTDTSSVDLSWTKGSSVPFSRVFVTTNEVDWEPISDFLRGEERFTWNLPAAFSGQTVMFKVQSTDLAVELGSATSDSVLLGIDTTNTASTLTDAPSLTLPSTGRSPFSGETESITVVQPKSYIRAEHYDTVYYVDDVMHRHPVINEQIFFTWEPSFNAVLTVTDATLSVLPLSSPLLPKPGVVLVKIQSTASVFAIDVNEEGASTLRHIPDEPTAQSLYGNNWADYVIDVEPTLFSRFILGAPITVSDIVNTQPLIKRIHLGA